MTAFAIADEAFQLPFFLFAVEDFQGESLSRKGVFDIVYDAIRASPRFGDYSICANEVIHGGRALGHRC